MDKNQAKAILQRIVNEYRSKPYDFWKERVGSEPLKREQDAGGVHYQIAVEAHWDDRPDQAIRVLFAIDDGGWRAMLPVTDSFILMPDGSFVDESATH